MCTFVSADGILGKANDKRTKRQLDSLGGGNLGKKEKGLTSGQSKNLFSHQH